MRQTKIFPGMIPLALLCLALPDMCFAQGSQGLADRIEAFITNEVMYILAGVILLFTFYYGARMILESQSDSVLTNARQSFLYAVVGLGVFAAMTPIRFAFVSGTPLNPINVSPLIPEVNSLVAFVITFAEGVFTIMLTINALRLISAQDDSGIEGARKAIVVNVIGIVLMFLASAIVSTIAGNSPQIIAAELAGIASFIIGLMGGFSVIALIVAGIMLIVSTDESLKERAKKIIIGTIIAIIIALGSYALIHTFAI